MKDLTEEKGFCNFFLAIQVKAVNSEIKNLAKQKFPQGFPVSALFTVVGEAGHLPSEK